ncbi:MAG: SpoIID/LytB domain-containing protein, partial [Candidatus Xenobia bacterium]
MRLLPLLLVLLLATIGSAAPSPNYPVRVGLELGASKVTIGGSGDIVVENPANQVLGHVRGTLSARASSQGIRVGSRLFPGSELVLHPAVGHLSLDGRGYRGDLLLHESTDSNLDVINRLDLEDYIAGVVGGEIPSSWPAEALKAQAVACRSYALAKIQSTRNALYDVAPTDKDQVYEGMAAEHASTLSAVRETRGQVLTFGGNIIKAYFSSSCGGHTEDAAVVFGEDEPYLKGVADPYCKDSPYQVWDREYTVEQLKKAFEGGGMGNLGQLLAIQARDRTASGRVGMLAVVAEKGEQVFRGIDVRRILGYRELRSTRFDVKVERTIPVYYEHVIQGPDRVETKVSIIPSTIEIGFEETQPRWAGMRIDHKMTIMDVLGRLAKHAPKECYAMVVRDGHVVKTPVKIQHGVWAEGLQKVV